MTIVKSDYDTAREFLLSVTPDLQLSALTNNAQECVLGDYPTINHIKNKFGEKKAVAWIAAQLMDYQNRFSPKEKLTIIQLETLAHLVVDGFYHLKVTEFMLFLRESLYQAKYEQYYGSIDTRKFMTNLQIFLKQTKWQIIDEHNAREAIRKQEESMANSMTADEWARYRKEHGIEVPEAVLEMERMISQHNKANAWREKHGQKAKRDFRS